MAFALEHGRWPQGGTLTAKVYFYYTCFWASTLAFLLQVGAILVFEQHCVSLSLCAPPGEVTGKSGPPVVAPPGGLVLNRVFYGSPAIECGISAEGIVSLNSGAAGAAAASTKARSNMVLTTKAVATTEVPPYAMPADFDSRRTALVRGASFAATALASVGTVAAGLPGIASAAQRQLDQVGST